MATMSLDKQLQQYWPLLGKEEKKSVLSKIEAVLEANGLPLRMTKEEFIIQYNKEIDEAEARIAEGYYTTQEYLEKESETW